MKSASLPAVAVEPGLLDDIEAGLEPGETLVEFIETAVRASLLRRTETQAAFLARGLASLEEAHRTGTFHSLEAVEQRLMKRLEEARAHFSLKHGSSS